MPKKITVRRYITVPGGGTVLVPAGKRWLVTHIALHEMPDAIASRLGIQRGNYYNYVAFGVLDTTATQSIATTSGCGMVNIEAIAGDVFWATRKAFTLHYAEYDM